MIHIKEKKVNVPPFFDPAHMVESRQQDILVDLTHFEIKNKGGDAK